MAIRRKEKRTERSKLDATPPWETKRPRAHQVTTGPYDITDAPDDDVARIDLGALKVPVGADLEMRLDVDDAGQVASITLVGPTGQLQLGLFAAPRNEGIWTDVRTEIMASISAQGGTVSEQDGEFGTELGGKLPAPGGLAPVRFVAVDGPRWFLRGMLAGGPATGDAEAEPFLQVFRNTVVDRGPEPLPVRDQVPLTLPTEAQEQLADAVSTDDPGTA